MARGQIVILEGVHKGGQFEIGERLTIGRNRDNHIQIPYMRASRFHAEITSRKDGYWLKDLDSTSGTLVNGVPTHEKLLVNGDEIVIGNARMQFHFLGQEQGKAEEQQATRVSFDQAEGKGSTTAELHISRQEDLLSTRQDGNALEELRRLAKRFSTLYHANQLISSEAPPAKIYDEVLRQIFDVVPADRGVILVKTARNEELTLMAARGREASIDISHVSVSRTIINKSMEQRVAILTCDAMQDYQFSSQSSVIAHNIRSAICAPLVHGDSDVLGIIYLDTQSIVKVFDQDMLQLVSAIAGPAAIAIKNSHFIEDLKEKTEELQQSYWNTITVIANSIEARDKYTIGHAWRVTRFGIAMARELGWTPRQIEVLEMGGVLHDVGKVGIRDSILGKNGDLDDEEFRVMRRHPEIGSRILRDVPFLGPAIPYARSHHERWDGNGYPDGLRGNDIPIEGRLLAIADAFDAMTSDRVYRKGMSSEEAIRRITHASGTQFDPTLAELFIQVCRAGKVDYVLQRKAQVEVRRVTCPSCTTELALQEDVHPGDEVLCPICRKRIRLVLLQGILGAEQL